MKKYSRFLILLTVLVGVISVALVLSSALMTRLNPLGFRTALTLFRYGVYAAIGGTVLGMLTMVVAGTAGRKKGLVASACVFVICIGVVLQANKFKSRAMALPLIHDITTDTERPPEFQAIVPLREGTAANSLVYEGARIAEQQKIAYPEIQPLIFDLSKHLAFYLALDVVRDMGWKVIHHSEAEGHIEAIETTTFFGFTDDIVIRLTDMGAQTRLDIRSVSRVGLSDIGANADRITKFIELANLEKTKPAYRSTKE